MKSIAIHQPNFAPWIGYFHKINQVDEFVLLDDVQYVKQSPSSRNYIKDKKGEIFLLILPIKKKNTIQKKYNEIEIDYSQPWQRKHLNKIKDSYYKSPSFEEIYNFVELLYSIKHESLASLNIQFITETCKLLKLQTHLVLSSNISIENDKIKNDRNIAICKSLNATHYISGTGAKNYNNEELYKQNNLKLIYQNYKPIIYPQLNGIFIPNLSILDYLFNVSKNSYPTIFK